jgi:PPOX class probable FMN-dependent enzyme
MTDGDVRFSEYSEIVTSVEEIRATIAEPTQASVDKVIDRLDDYCRAIIAKSPFIMIASANPDGQPDISPKGDPLGFVRVLDEKHLAIPERPGNRRLDTFINLLDNPNVAIIFMIPGKGETLRVKGEARIVRDEALRETMAVKGRIPEFAVVVHVEQAMMHCPKSIVRSKLWEPDAWPDHSDTPSIAETSVAHANLDMTPEEYRASMVAAGRAKLY